MLESLSVNPSYLEIWRVDCFPQGVRSMKQLGKSGDLLMVCYRARKVLRFTYALESLGDYHKCVWLGQIPR